MKVHIVTAQFDDGDEQWEDRLGVFRLRTKAERVMREYDKKMELIGEKGEPIFTPYDPIKYPRMRDYYDSEEYRKYEEEDEEYRQFSNFCETRIATLTIDGER